jgi:hypothetical protein
LKDQDFQQRLIVYLEQLIKLDYDWAAEPDEVDVYGQPPSYHPAYRFPTYNSDGESNWFQDFLYDSKNIAVATQLHHHTWTCRKKGTRCRFGFDGQGKPIVPVTTIDSETGVIELRRHNAKVNNHNPLIAAVTRSNHDLKLTFLSGYKSLQSMYYMTTYVAKFEDDTSDLAAMESAWKGLERDKILPTSDDQERLRRLVI